MPDIETTQGHLNAEGKRFAIVASRYNEIISSRLISGAQDCLLRHGAQAVDLHLYRVPGSFEIPLVARKIADGGDFDAVICLGTIVRGETPHFDFVASEAARGVGRAGSESGVPVIFGIVTTDTMDQAVDRAGGRTGNRGAEAALTAIEMANLVDTLEKSDE
ncbi:MAG: 6,7-dimethyl-8-ribityllumazine synthase [Planctomycetes bacterium]|nr:6,7-dimethyl-8-ribityllumazine synthase [Planctomycetota bacterium]